MIGLFFRGKLIIDMKHRSLQEAYNGVYRRRPKFNDYFPPENRLVILERKSPTDENQQQKSTALYNDLAAASDGLLRVDSKASSNTLAYYKRKGARLALTDLGKQQTPESYNFDFVKQLADKSEAIIDETIGVPLNKKEQRSIAKKTGKEVSLSSSFNTYYIKRDGVEVSVVLCAKFNKGIDFEETLFTNFQEQLSSDLESGGLLEQVLSRIGIVNQYKNLTITREAGKSAKRVMGYTDDEIQDVGKEIGDFTIVNNKTGKEYYISLKNQNGKTFGNKGVTGIFKEKIVNDPVTQKARYEVTPGNVNVLDDFFASITGDKDEIKNKIAQGLEEYANGAEDETAYTKSKFYFENVAASSKFINIVQTAIKSGLGYGYYYLKMKTKTEYIYIDLTTREKLDTFVRENIQIKNITLQFPYCIGPGDDDSSKAFRILIHTKNGSVYNISVRTKNATKFVPTEFILSVTKFEANPKNKEDMILSVIPPALAARATSKAKKNK